MSTTKKRSARAKPLSRVALKSAKAKVASTPTRSIQWLALAKMAIQRGQLTKARLLLKRIVAARGALADQARRLLARVEKQLSIRPRSIKRSGVTGPSGDAGKAVRKTARRGLTNKAAGRVLMRPPAKSGKAGSGSRAGRTAPSILVSPGGSTVTRRTSRASRSASGGPRRKKASRKDDGDLLRATGSPGEAPAFTDLENLLEEIGANDQIDRDADDGHAAGRRDPTSVTDVRLVETATAPPIVKRTPHLSLSTKDLHPGDTFVVKVFANKDTSPSGETADDIVLRGAIGQTTFDLEVWLTGSQHFTVLDPRVGQLAIAISEAETKAATFNVQVNEHISLERAVLIAYFFHKGRACGKVERQVALEKATPPAAGGGRGDHGVLEVSTGASEPDLTIDITDPGRTRRALCCKVSSRLLRQEEQPEPEDWNLNEESHDLVKGFMDEFVRAGSTSDERILSLKGAGAELYHAAPESFKRVLWMLIDRKTPPRSISVTSEEPYIPWELMVPTRRLANGTLERRAPLGVEFAVGRWLHNDHLSPASRISLSDSFVIAPDYPGPKPAPLKNAPAEVALVLGRVAGDWIKPADLKSLDARLGAGGRSLLHMVCHGADDPRAGIQAIYLDGGVKRLLSLQVGQIAGVIEAFKKKPLVFLNACDVGRPAIALVGIGGFAKAFIDLGASGVIAPLWSVRDTIAFDVATRFYNAIVPENAGAPTRSFADVLREIRALAYDPEIGEDTYAAYCFYGDPLATP